MSIKVSFSPSNMACIIEHGFTSYLLIHDPKEIDVFISKLQEAKQQMVEHKNRLAEEGYNLWENN